MRNPQKVLTLSRKVDECKPRFAGTDITLRISTDATKTFKDACFPVALSQKGYTIFDFHTVGRCWMIPG